MNARQESILHRLGIGIGFTAKELASEIGAPAPSIRRAIRSLRERGYEISQSSQRGYML